MKPGPLNKITLLAAATLGLAACEGRAPPEAQEEPELEIEESDVVVDNSALPGVTPMAERVATIGFLNKRNGLTRDLELSPGQEVRIGDARVRLRACETTAPWEDQPWTGAFVQLDVRVRGSEQVERVFSGWVYRESPSLNVVEHPVYDVWVKSCAMSFPEGPVSPPETEPLPSESSA
ncbi:DUF2155 domain-containing protein [Sphingomicrobium sp. XHP0239]|uniref:DUF2155 domain-containing protein n=1 Tax=Sphingomicrobium maritimum TaxID=3133972 RepID=UPI0031CC5CE3